MLGKLFKYEWKAVSWMNVLLAIISAGSTLLGVIYLHTPMWERMMEGRTTPASGMLMGLWAIIGVGGALAYFLVLVGVKFGQMIYMGVRYYRSMFSDEGYLTHTLPVKPGHLLISKVVTAGCWVFLINFLLIVLLVVLVISAVRGIAPVTYGDIWEALLRLIKEIFQSFNSAATFLFYLAVGIVGPFLDMAILFGSLTLGHYSGKNKGLMGILAYFGVKLALAMIVVLTSASLISAVQSTGSANQWIIVNGKNLCDFVVDAVAAVGMMLWAHAIIKNRLNLE